MVYAALFSVGFFCLAQPGRGIGLAAVAALSAGLVWREIRQQNWDAD
jgi:hypothetical protein